MSCPVLSDEFFAGKEENKEGKATATLTAVGKTRRMTQAALPSEKGALPFTSNEAPTLRSRGFVMRVSVFLLRYL